MALTHIVLDQNPPACIWLSLAIGDSDRATSTGENTKWLPARYLPVDVEARHFPKWARGLVLGNNADVVDDFIANHGTPHTPTCFKDVF